MVANHLAHKIGIVFKRASILRKDGSWPGGKKADDLPNQN